MKKVCYGIKEKKNENKFKNASLTQKLTGYLPQQKENAQKLADVSFDNIPQWFLRIFSCCFIAFTMIRIFPHTHAFVCIFYLQYMVYYKNIIVQHY